MYTVLENARIVISLLKKHNIRYIVLSPGGSNIPIVQGVQNDPFFKCYSVVDERSAMYFAIGLYLQTGEMIATSCTSAQATRNYLPGLTEAFYKHVPILAITMSKHPMYLGQDYMQCPIQTSLPIDAVKKSFSLPCINSVQDRYQCIRTANEAILELSHNGYGPVQLNIEELDSQTWSFDKTITNLPDVRSIYRYYDTIGIEKDLNNKKIMLLIGEHRPFSEREYSAINSFCESYNVLVYTNHISNFRNKYSVNGNIVVSTITENLFEKEFQPDILLSIGGLTGDYSLYFKLFNSLDNSFEHWRIDVDGKVVDTYNKLTRVYQIDIESFFNKATTLISQDHSYYETWIRHCNSIDWWVDIPFSNLYAARKLHDMIPDGSKIHFAILNSLRTWSLMPIPSNIQASSNVAAFGIDGCLSTMVGQSVVTNALCFHITGDLSFFYDMNAIGIRHIKNNLRILLINNNGGMEFKFGDLASKTDVSSYIAADNHFKNARGWAETNGFQYLSASHKDEFDKNVVTFISESLSPIIFELFVEPQDEKDANSRFISCNLKGTIEENILLKTKVGIKNIIGVSTLNKVKNVLLK